MRHGSPQLSAAVGAILSSAAAWSGGGVGSIDAREAPGWWVSRVVFGLRRRGVGAGVSRLSRRLCVLLIGLGLLAAACGPQLPPGPPISSNTTVGVMTTVPSGPGALPNIFGVWPSPDGTQLALFQGTVSTYAARLTTSSVHPYPAVQIPGYFNHVTFGPDGTAYLIGQTVEPSSSTPTPAQLLKLAPGAATADVLYTWPADFFATDRPLSAGYFAVEYIGGYLYTKIASTAYAGEAALQKFDLNGNPLGQPSNAASWSSTFRAATGTLSSDDVPGVFSYFDLTTLAQIASTAASPIGSGPVAIGHDGSWSTLVGFNQNSEGVCGSDMHLVRVGTNAQTLLNVSLASIEPASPGRCDLPGVAVLSDLTTAVGMYDSAGALHIWLVSPQGTVSHLTDIAASSSESFARFASDNTGHLVVASGDSLPCTPPGGVPTTCEQAQVAVYSEQGLVSSTTVGGTVGESDLVHGYVSVNDNSVALSIIRCTDTNNCAGPSGTSGPDYDVLTLALPTARETWHDPAGAESPPLSVTPTSGLPGTQFAASWSCPGGAVASLAVTNSSGIAAIPNPLPTSENGTDYTAGFQGAASPGSYMVTASCGMTALAPVPITLLGATYVALGDSFASGEGATNFISGTDQPGVDMCHRATNGYAEQVAGQLGYVNGNTFDFAACSGARIADIYNRHSNTDQTSEDTSEIAQELHLSKAATKLVTISIGGDDVGFVDVLTSCVQVSFARVVHVFVHTGGYGCAIRDAGPVRTALGWLQHGRPPGCYQIPGISMKTGKPETSCGPQVSLTQVYEDIARAAAPGAKVLVLGYPEIWAPRFSRAPLATCAIGKEGPITFARVIGVDASWMNQVATQLNNIISTSAQTAAVATGANIQYVNIDAAFKDHRLCDTKAQWFNDLINSLSPSGYNRSLHPNDAGQRSAYFTTLRPKL